MKIVFISDLHLSEYTFSNNQLFLSYMKDWQKNIDALYILGDFFDYWLGDDDNNVFIKEIKQSLKQFTQQKPIYFIGGNHDFAIGNRFAKETGITLLPDCSVINLDNKLVLISHGDIFCSLDVKYQRMKKILQNPITIFLLTKTPLSFRRKIKDKLKKKSGENYNLHNSQIYNVVDATIVKYALQNHTDTVIHGHTHNPGKYFATTDKVSIPRIELPDWVSKKVGGYLLYDSGKFSFKYEI